MEDCIFCKIIKGELPSSKIYEDDDLLALMDIQPINRGHILIIPKEHKVLMTELNDNLLGKMGILSRKINQAIRDSNIKPEGVNLFLADGEAAGQEVFNSHIHIIPRFKGDGFGFVFPKNYANRPSRNDLNATAEIIRRQMQL